MKIYKIAQADENYAWILPSGKIIPMNGITHTAYVIQNPKLFNIQETSKYLQELDEDMDLKDPVYNIAYEHGAIRLGTYGGSYISVIGTRAAIHSLKNSIIEWAMIQKQKRGNQDTYLELEYFDPANPENTKYETLTNIHDIANNQKNIKTSSKGIEDVVKTRHDIDYERKWEQQYEEDEYFRQQKLSKPSKPFVHNYYSPRQKNLTPQEEHIRNIAIGLSKGDPQAINEAAQDMAKLVPLNSTLVPIPNSQGDTSSNLKLAQEIAKLTNSKVIDVLASNPRDSQKERRRQGIPGLQTEDIQTTLKNTCETDNVILIDNVRTTGATINSAMKLLPCATYLVYAQAEEILNWYEKSKI